MLVGVSPSDPIVLVGVILVLMAAGALGCAVPARRAIRVDPRHFAAGLTICYGSTGGSIGGLNVLMHVGWPNPPALFPVPPFGFDAMS